MAVVEGILIEEVQRLNKEIKHYKEMLNALPRGSIFIRQMGSSSFAYRKRKENGKVLSEYLGNVKSDEVQKQIELSQEYKRIKNNIRIVEKELIKLQKALKAYD